MPDNKHDLVDGIVDLLKGRAPLPARPQPPGLPKRPATETPGTPQYELTKAQDAARNNPAFQPKDDGTTVCNRAVCETVKRMKGPMGALTYPSGEYAVANDAARYLAEDALLPSGNWRAVDTPREAQQLANQGIVVVGVQANRGTERGRQRHGHMVTVRPEANPGLAENVERKLSTTDKSKQILPIVNNIGAAIG